MYRKRSRDSTTPASDEATYNLFLPVLLLALTVVLWTGFQTLQLVKEDSALDQARQNQEQLVINASKLRKQLDIIASSTQKLADQGNPNAKLIVDELKKRGVSINPNGNQNMGMMGQP